jgi:hypothetical protein
MHLAGWSSPGGTDMQSVIKITQEAFGHLAAARISGAQNEDLIHT